MGSEALAFDMDGTGSKGRLTEMKRNVTPNTYHECGVRKPYLIRLNPIQKFVCLHNYKRARHRARDIRVYQARVTFSVLDCK